MAATKFIKFLTINLDHDSPYITFSELAIAVEDTLKRLVSWVAAKNVICVSTDTRRLVGVHFEFHIDSRIADTIREALVERNIKCSIRAFSDSETGQIKLGEPILCSYERSSRFDPNCPILRLFRGD